MFMFERKFRLEACKNGMLERFEIFTVGLILILSYILLERYTGINISDFYISLSIKPRFLYTSINKICKFRLLIVKKDIDNGRK